MRQPAEIWNQSMSTKKSSRPIASFLVKPERIEWVPYLMLILATIFWSGNFIAGRSIRGEIDPLSLNFIRWIVALIAFAPFVWRRCIQHRRTILKQWQLLIGLGATGIAAFHTMVYFSLRETTSINALLILSVAPTLIIIGAGILQGLTSSRVQYIGISISLLGAGILITRLDPLILLNLDFNHGDVWMMAAVVVWTAYSLLLVKRPDELPQDVTLAVSMFAGIIMMTPLLLIFSHALILAPSWELWITVSYISLFASLIAFACWSLGVTALGPGRAGQFVHLMPVFGTVLSFIILDEKISAIQILGALVVLSGIILFNRAPKH